MQHILAYRVHIQRGLLVFVCVAAGWFALYGSRSSHVVAGLILAYLLYLLRKHHRILYGAAELVVGIGALINTYPLARQTCGTFAESCEPFPWYVIPLGTIISVYILIRGLDNIEQGWKQVESRS
jgi:hypothetical protein